MSMLACVCVCMLLLRACAYYCSSSSAPSPQNPDTLLHPPLLSSSSITITLAITVFLLLRLLRACAEWSGPGRFPRQGCAGHSYPCPWRFCCGARGPQRCRDKRRWRSDHITQGLDQGLSLGADNARGPHWGRRTDENSTQHVHGPEDWPDHLLPGSDQPDHVYLCGQCSTRTRIRGNFHGLDRNVNGFFRWHHLYQYSLRL
jgi:hypothetical protein